MVTEQVRIAVPDVPSGGRLRQALGDLGAELRGTARDLEVVLTLKSPEREIVLAAVLDTLERWLEAEDLHATRLQVGGEIPHIVRAAEPTPAAA
jgi:hypothetical protein